MLLATLTVLAASLTVTMFATKQSMLGFPFFIFWSLLGGYAYTASTVTWDLYYLLFFASLGMAMFCAIAAFALRTKKEERQAGEEYTDEGKDDSQLTNESRNVGADGAESFGPTDRPDNNDQPSRRIRVIRERAERRREQGVVRRTGYGEFK